MAQSDINNNDGNINNNGNYEIELSPPNFPKFQEGAERRDPVAMRQLARCYMKGIGCERNPQEAVRWFISAAEMQDSWARYKLACCYLNGEGVEKNKSKAEKWFRRAVEQGNKRANDELRKLEKK